MRYTLNRDHLTLLLKTVHNLDVSHECLLPLSNAISALRNINNDWKINRSQLITVFEKECVRWRWAMSAGN